MPHSGGSDRGGGRTWEVAQFNHETHESKGGGGRCHCGEESPWRSTAPFASPLAQHSFAPEPWHAAWSGEKLRRENSRVHRRQTEVEPRLIDSDWPRIDRRCHW